MKEKDERWEVQQELEQIAPELAQLKKQSKAGMPDDTPPRYFRELPDALWQRIQAEEQAKPTALFSESWSQLTTYAWNILRAPVSIGLATMALLLIGIWFLRDKDSTDWTAQKAYRLEALGSLPEEVLYDYVLDHISTYNTSDFAAFGEDIPWDGLLPIQTDEEALDQIIDEYLEQADEINFNELL